jgi:nucleotide-binding universal stress UspA family protein
MKKILVPIDFSLHSLSAFIYANQLCADIKANLTLLNVVNGSFNTGETLTLEPLKQVEDSIMDRLRYFSTEYIEEQNIKINHVPTNRIVRFGIPGFTIADMANEEEFDYIVMGTRNNHGIFDKIFGSTSSVVIASSKCPIVVIHEQTVYKEIDKIVFGFDKKDGLEDALGFLQRFNRDRKAQIDFVHVVRGDDDGLKKSVDEIIDEMMEEYIDYPFTIKKIKGKGIEKTLIDYSINAEADVMILYHQKTGLLERIFKRSASVEIAHNLPLPVIIVPPKIDDEDHD